MRRFAFFLSLLLFSGCYYVEPTTYYTPVLIQRSELENSITYAVPRNVTNPGKIYTYQNYIFINELYLGVHVINNLNPELPENIGFITIPGNVDIAIKDNILYADNAVDLITVDLSNMATPTVLSRKRKVFPEPTPPDLGFIPEEFNEANRPEDTIIIKWEKK